MEILKGKNKNILHLNMIKLNMWRSIGPHKKAEEWAIGSLELSHVATENQVADCLIKGLNSIGLIRLCDKMSLMNIFCPS
jgi:hypothetical protein